MKRYFLTGLLTLLPLTITIIILLWLFNLFTAPFLPFAEELTSLYEEKLGPVGSRALIISVISHALSFILLVCIALVLGFLSQRLFFKSLMGRFTNFMHRLPLIRSIWRLSSEVTSAILAEGKRPFQRAALMPFMTEKGAALAFVTGEVPPQLKKALKNLDYTLYLPTAPHPLSGFLVLAPKSEIIDIDVGVEEAFKFLLSCGVADVGRKKT